MTAATAVLPPPVVKEIRALFPTYAAALVTVALGSVGGNHTIIAAGLLAFALGSIALGAQSFGHEYSHRTLGLLLSQPLERRRLFLYKFGVLAVMLVTLAGVTLFLFHDLLRLAASPDTQPAMLIMVAACGLFVAPWLTLASRSTLAAIVFTIAIPGLVAVASDLAGVALFGLRNAAAVDHFKLLAFWRTMVVICAIGAVASWRLFMRLEAIEGRAPAVQLPGWLRGRADAAGDAFSRPRHRVWMILAKELRLQQMALLVAAVLVFLWMATAALERSVSGFPDLPLNSLLMLYGCVVAMLIGATASAEERQLGTAEWQILLPMPAWQQWVLKAGVALGLALMLGSALPAVLRYLAPTGDDVHQAARAWRETMGMVVVLTACSLYVSSLCTSGVRALVLSFPIVVAASLFVIELGEMLAPVMFRHSYMGGSRPFLDANGRMLAVYAIGAGLAVLLLSLAFRNYRWADRSAARILKQAAVVASYLVAGLLLLMLGMR